MADWYTSSTGYAAIAAFVPSAVYSVGNIVKPTAPALKAQWAFRCTTAGTASTEPAWPTANNSTITTGGATFTNVTGQSAFGWSAAAGDLPTLLGAVGTQRFVAGDRLFVSSDHTETQTASTNYGSGAGTVSYTSGQFLSVNRAGSVPPVAADLTAGATVIQSGSTTLNFNTQFPCYHYGIIYSYTGTSVGIGFASSGQKAHYFDTCQLYLNTATTTSRITATGAVNIILRNTTVRFGSTSQSISAGGSAILELLWLDTPSAISGATIPTILFQPSGAGAGNQTVCRGVDLSAIVGTLYQNAAAGDCGSKFLFDSCRIASAATRLGVAGIAGTREIVELVNCYDGTNIISESYQPGGAVTTEITITLSGGATDNVGTFSHKMVSNANVDKYVNTLNSFWLDANYATTGSSKTATVEIVSSASLNNDEISLLLEYEGTAGSSVASFGNSLPATVLTAAGAVTSSSATWNSLPATPVRQHLQVTFTPRTAGRVRAQVRLGKVSTTVYVNPQVTIS